MSPNPRLQRAVRGGLARIGLPTLLLIVLHISACRNSPTDPVAGSTGWDSVVSGTQDMLTDVQFIDHDHGWIACWSDTVMRTTDGGSSWTRHSAKAPGRTGYGIADICFTDRLNGWALGYQAGELLHTTDGGASWALVPLDPLHTYAAGGLCFVDRDHGWFRGGLPAEIISTTDGGLTWRRQMFAGWNATLSTISFTSRWNGWISGIYDAVAGDSISLLLHTIDGGVTWDSTILHERLRRVQFVDSTNGWIMASGSTILHTTDGGVSWTRHGFTTSTYGSDIYFVDRNTGWLTMRLPDLMTGGGVYDVLMRTTDAGEQWEPVAQKVRLVQQTEITSMSFTDPLNGWAVGSNGVIWHTTTGGVP